MKKLIDPKDLGPALKIMMGTFSSAKQIEENKPYTFSMDFIVKGKKYGLVSRLKIIPKD